MIIEKSVKGYMSNQAGKATAFRRSRLAAAIGITGMMLVAGMSGSAFAAKDGLCKDGTPRPCKPEGGGKPPTEIGSNNLSFPVILSDNVAPDGFPQDGPWRSANITDVNTQCVGEEGVTPGEPVSSDDLCYYGRKVIVVNEGGTVGEITFEPEDYDCTGQIDEFCKIWWLQKRPQNFWRALSTGHDNTTPLVVSAVDVGDLLESTPALQARIIRVEFNLLQDATTHYDGAVQEFAPFLDPNNCVKPPTEVGQSVGCFAALGMSGAVPGTEQSGNETQGTDFFGTQTLLDPTTVRIADPDAEVEDDEIPIHALVYSHCARLVIQKIDGNPVWDPTTGQWSGPGVGAPVVNTAAYNEWSVEVTSSGSIVYGYNWNAKTAATGTYRLTFVLDGNDDQGPQCPVVPSGTMFGSDDYETTELVNFGDVYFPALVPKGNYVLGGGDEGGLVFLDVPITAKTGGGGKPGGGKP
jgi:hypothetical protein